MTVLWLFHKSLDSGRVGVIIKRFFGSHISSTTFTKTIEGGEAVGEDRIV